jgi:hypothetical protein
LQNSTYWLNEGQQINLSFKLKDQVKAVHGMTVFNGSPQLSLDGLYPVKPSN